VRVVIPARLGGVDVTASEKEAIGNDSFEPASLFGARTRIKDSSSDWCGESVRVSLATGVGERLVPFGDENIADALFGWAARFDDTGGEADRVLSEDFSVVILLGGERRCAWGVEGDVVVREMFNGLRVGDWVGEDGGDIDAFEGDLVFEDDLVVVWPSDGDVADFWKFPEDRFAVGGGENEVGAVRVPEGEFGDGGLLACEAMVEACAVAACRRVGGAAAICLAFARLAAIAAATLDFFVSTIADAGGVKGERPEGAALSSCLRAVASSVLAIASARSLHTASNAQNKALALSRRPAFWSANVFLIHLSKTSSPPVISMSVLDLDWLVSTTVRKWATEYWRTDKFLSWTPCHSIGSISLGWGCACKIISLAVFWVWIATIFLVREPKRKSGMMVNSTNGS
jgi:hypothetical protein